MTSEYRAIVAVFNSDIEIVSEAHYRWENPELNEGLFSEILEECIKKINRIEDGFMVSAQIGYFNERGGYTRICRMSGKAMIHRNAITIETDEKTITIPA